MVWKHEYVAVLSSCAQRKLIPRAVNTLGSCIGTMGAIPCCIICPNPYKPVSQGNVGLVTKFGRFYRAVDPGLVKINPLSERLIQVDVKIQIVGMYLCI
jgi:erythrocyte band 7 integral membrane protein